MRLETAARALATDSEGGSVGLDFGTTNSAIAKAGADGHVTLAAFGNAGAVSHTFPSVLYVNRTRHEAGTRIFSYAGASAVAEYLDSDPKGRFIQSLKAFLADRRFDGTNVFGRNFTLEYMIGLILQHLLASAAPTLGRIPMRVVVGRPVHYSNALSAEDDAYALARVTDAIKRVGFEEIAFEYEPVAAAYSYEQHLTRDELIVIGDFGGGTSDFSILHVGPTVRRRGHTKADILASEGVALAGDAFDRQIIRNLVAPRLGLGSEYVSPPNKFLPIPAWPYTHLERWHYLSFLNAPQVLDMLERVRHTALIPERLDAFLHLIKGELGYQLHEAVRKTKFALSERTEAEFVFECDPIMIRQQVTRAVFEGWIEDELHAIATCITRLLQKAGVHERDVDHVFLTGGSSFVPAVRRLFIDRFGASKITGGQELTSVATGLALRAAEEWPAKPASRR